MINLLNKTADFIKMINLLSKTYHYIKSENLKEHYNEAINLISEIDNFTIEHVYREDNKRADQLANQALDE